MVGSETGVTRSSQEKVPAEAKDEEAHAAEDGRNGQGLHALRARAAGPLLLLARPWR